MKVCNKCKISKDLSEFYTRRRRGKVIGYINPCKTCHSARCKTDWLNNKVDILRRHKEIRTDNKTKAVEFLGGKCADCAIKFPLCVYDFHHLGDKDFPVSSLLLSSWHTIEKELIKCVLLCANCHRLRHYTNNLFDGDDLS